jgi:hypothetical protein
MKKNLLLPLFAFCILQSAFSQTNVSGFINANTNWTLAGSPYIVVGNTIIPNGYTLTIDPGVVVKFDSAKTLQINGELHAVGAAGNRIIFTSNRISPAPGDWRQIQFSDTAADAVFNSSGNYVSGCIMKYCDVSYGGNGEIQTLNSSLYISNCNITYSSGSALSCHGFLKIDSTCIRHNHSGGTITISSYPYCPYIIEHDTMDYNVWQALFLNASPFPNCADEEMIIRNNYFAHTDSSSALAVGSSNRVLITENDFVNNRDGIDGYSAIDLSGESGNSTVQCNRFVGNQGTRGCAIYLGNYGQDTIRNNLFDSNSRLWGSVMYADRGCCADVSISDNRFLNNIVPGGNILFLRSTASGNNIGTLFLNQNEFMNNCATSDIYLSVSSANFNAQFADISNNNFMDDSITYAIDNHTPFGGPNIDADSNFWNTSSSQHIDSIIDDYFDNLSYSIVNYSPILTSPAAIDTICPSISMSIAEVSQNNKQFIIYPNPSHSTFTLSLDQLAIANSQLALYDLTGRKIYTQQINNQSTIINSQFSPGVYFVKVQSGEKVWTEKLVVE